MSLSDGEKTFQQMLDEFSRLERRVGHFRLGELDADFAQAVRDDLDLLLSNALVTQREGLYTVTAEGREKASEYEGAVARVSRLLDRALLPETVSVVGVGAHFVLAALKLAVGAASGSMGLLSDGTDTLLGGLSSVLVYLGLKLDKERYVNVVLVLLMMGVGLSLSVGVIRRLLQPLQPQADVLSFSAALVSAVICLGLGQYQRYVGARSGSLPLISQSIDSRNHAIVAVGVAAGLVAARLNFGVLDTLVGLGVAILILKSACELGLETVKALPGEEVDYSKYEPGVVGKYKETKERQLRDWILYLVDRKGPISRADLHTLAEEALDFEQVALLRQLRMAADGGPHNRVENAIAALLGGNLISVDDRISITDLGQREIREILQQRQRAFWHRHTSP
jgi:divalent metal cation (Fe/Co/Zn/Cd) transporter